MKNALAVALPSPKKMKRPAADTDNRGELNNINVEMTENGCIVRCSFDPDKIDPKMDRYSQMPEDEKYSFDDIGKASEYIKGMMTDQMDHESGEDGGKKIKVAEKKAPVKAAPPAKPGPDKAA